MGDSSRLFGFEQQAQGSRQGQIEPPGYAACESVIQDDQGIVRFESQRQHFPLSRSKIGNERKHGQSRDLTDFDPREGLQIGQSDPQDMTRRDLPDYAFRDQNSPVKIRQEIEEAKLMKVLQG